MDTDVIVTGCASEFHDSSAVALLLQHEFITLTTTLDFFESLKLHGVVTRRTDYILLEQRVYILSRIIRAADEYYFLLHEIATCLSVDTLGAYYVEHTDVGDHLPMRLLQVTPVCQATSSWSFHVRNRVYLVPKY